MNLGMAALDARIVGLRAESRSLSPNINQDETNPKNIRVYSRREVRLMPALLRSSTQITVIKVNIDTPFLHSS